MGLREIKARARRDLHRGMKVTAYYYDPETKLPSNVEVRTHYDFAALGEVRGTSFGYAERQEMTPRLIFMLEPTETQPIPIDPDPQALVIVSALEGYRVNYLDPIDLLTRKAFCTQMTPAEIEAYVTPPDIWAHGDATIPGMSSGTPPSMIGRMTAEGSILLLIPASGTASLPALTGG
jgi:hypothetical protein